MWAFWPRPGPASGFDSFRGMGEPVREQWISEVSPGKTFADVGGLWGTVNEQVTVAAAAGATSLTMIDLAPRDGTEHDLWKLFDQRRRKRRVGEVTCINGNIDDTATIDQAGTFDVVHCSGVLYHCPQPLHTLRQLRAITRETLVLGTATMPEVVSTSTGTVRVEPGAAMLVPALTQSQRVVFGEWLRENGVTQAHGVNHALETAWNFSSEQWQAYAPWWWFFTRDYVAALLEVAGFEVRNIASYWNGRGTLYLASPAAHGSARAG